MNLLLGRRLWRCGGGSDSGRGMLGDTSDKHVLVHFGHGLGFVRRFDVICDVAAAFPIRSCDSIDWHPVISPGLEVTLQG
jgi:hypothetical protein